MLWFDNDPARDLEAKVSRAAQHYERKYGRAPNLCIVNPTTASERETKASGPSPRVSRDLKLPACGVTVQTSKTVLPNHFWIGVRESGK